MLMAAAWTGYHLSRLALDKPGPLIYDADTLYGPAIASLAKARGLALIAIVHNVKSFNDPNTTAPHNQKLRLKDLERELSWLRTADQTWTISEFDRKIFELFGLRAQSLPYFPPKARRDELLEIRAARKALPKKHILILGTVGNSPTRLGMIEQLKFIEKNAHVFGDWPIVLAGFGTKQLPTLSSGRVTVLGEQSWESVKELLKNAIGLWAHQAPMTGALTRITEALTAGVPVVANRWAAVGFGSLNGLTVYEDIKEAATILVEPPMSAPSVPANAEAEAKFIAALRDSCSI